MSGCDLRKQRAHRGFIEDVHAEDLENFEETSFTFYLFSNDGHQGIDAHGDPELSANCVLRASVEGFDAKVLLEPFEKQLYLPALLIQLGDEQRTQTEVIGQEDQTPLLLLIIKTYSAQFVWVILGSIKGGKGDGLIRTEPRGAIHWMGMQPAVGHPGFGSDDEPGSGLVDKVQSAVIQVAPVHEIERSRLVDQRIQPGDFLRFCRCNQHGCGFLCM